jgi:hypothetical protein
MQLMIAGLGTALLGAVRPAARDGAGFLALACVCVAAVLLVVAVTPYSRGCLPQRTSHGLTCVIPRSNR